jgi:hypothetical protein
MLLSSTRYMATIYHVIAINLNVSLRNTGYVNAADASNTAVTRLGVDVSTVLALII